MSKPKKMPRPKARTPRGLRDRSGPELLAEQAMLARITAVYASYGYAPLDTPALEFTEALGKFLPDVDRPNAGVFSLQDDDEQWLSLRYDLTAPLARHVAEHYDRLPKPYRRYQVGTVWRNEKPGPGRFREFTQCDADCVGAPAPHADAEVIMMFADAIRAAGLEDGDVSIRVSSRKVMSGLLEAIGLDATDAGASGTVLRAMDKYDRLGAEGVRLLLGQGRRDESGDVTPGAGLSESQADTVLAFMQAASEDDAAALSAMRDVMSGSAVGAEGADELEAIASTLDALGYGARARLDPSVVRGLDYYTGPVFEAEVTFPVTNEKGETVVFGSVGSGGRYDGLVERFKGVRVPAVGCSIGVSRLLAALAARGQADEVGGPVVVLALEADRMADYHRYAAALRAEGVAAEVYLGGSGMRAQMKYADKRGAPVVVIRGEDERARGEVTVKDLVLGARLSETVESNEAWREGQPAQASVPEAEMVTAVKRALGR